MVFVACAGDVVDLGAGPLDPPEEVACDDGVQNGEETGVDCGGTCSPVCFDEPCICATSGALMPLACFAPEASGGGAILSADGTTVAFSMCHGTGRCQAYYWTEDTGRQALPALDDVVHVSAISADGQTMLLSTRPIGNELGPFEVVWHRVNGPSIPTGLLKPAIESGPLLSEDGRVVMGVAREEATGETHLARWSEAGGLERLASFGTTTLSALGHIGVTLTAMTPDASLVVGENEGIDSRRSFRWTEAGGLVRGLDDFAGAEYGGVIAALSRDGSSFAGLAFTGDTRGAHVFHSTPTGAFLDFGPMTPYYNGVTANMMALSDDGSVLAGTLLDDRGTQRGTYPFRSTEQSGMQPLRNDGGDFFGDRFISGDGSVIAGGTNDNMFLWTERGKRTGDIEASDSRRWDLGPATALSHDGDIVVGTGQCGGVPAIYRTVLSNW